MSVFDFPRIHFSGIMRVNVGTGNNDDYSSSAPGSANNYFYDQPTDPTNPHLRTFDSIKVKLSDTMPEMEPDKYLDWMKTDNKGFHHFVDKNKEEANVTPGYWNYYGSMSVWADNVKVTKIALNQKTAVDESNKADFPSIENWIGGNISYDRWPQLPKQAGQGYKERAEQLTTAIMTDIKSEGSSPGSQIFCDNVLFQDVNGQPVFYRDAGATNTYDNMASQPTKSSANWLASQGYECFFAGMSSVNGSLITNPGAGATFQCVIPFSVDFKGEQFLDILEQYKNPDKGSIQGIIVKYVMYLGVHPLNTSEAWAEKYKSTDFFDRLNERQCPVVGVVAPWYGEEANTEPDFASTQLGREIHAVPNLETKTIGGPPALPMTLSPIIARVTHNSTHSQYYLSLDVSKALTSYFTEVAGDLSIWVGKSADDTNPIYIGAVPYGNEANNKFLDPSDRWKIKANPATQLFATPQNDIIDLPITKEQYAMLVDDEGHFTNGVLTLTSNLNQFINTSSFQGKGQTQYLLMQEPNYFIMNNMRTLYAEQAAGKTVSKFRYEGADTDKTSAFMIVQRGKILQELPQDETFYMLSCFTVPLPMAYNNALEITPITSMEQLCVQLDVTNPGSYRFAVVSKTFLTKHQLKTFVDLDLYPISVAQVRVLPNEDYSQYYINPGSSEPIGNASLNFGVLYEHVLKPYHVLYPAMDQVRNLHDPEEWYGADSARRLMQRIDVNNFARSIFMPRTRDLSESRRQLLEAWCRKTLTASNKNNIA